MSSEEKKDGFDRLLDGMEGMVGKVTGVLKHAHYPDKDYDEGEKHPDVEDAEIVSQSATRNALAAPLKEAPIADRVEGMTIMVKIVGEMFVLHFNQDRTKEMFTEQRVTLGEWLSIAFEEVAKHQKLLKGG